jgi:chromosome segregation ATPase
MLTVNKLEKVMELEAQLREQYQDQLNEKDSAIAKLVEEKSALEKQVDELKGTIATQLETITDLSGKAGENQAVEQRNRELHNRSENLKEELSIAKSRVKTLQKELAAEREQHTALKKYDPERMKKNLDANKKKLAEKTKAADLLQKSLKQAKAENARLEQKFKELESQQSKEGEESSSEVQAEEAAA